MRLSFIKSLFHVVEDIGFNDNEIEAAEKKWGMTYSCEDIYMISDEQAEKIRGKYKKLPFGLRQWCEMSFYANNEDQVIMLMINDDYDLLYGSEDEEHFKLIEEFIETIEKDIY